MNLPKCDTFITEATFGLPIFKHPDDKTEVQKLINSLEQNQRFNTPCRSLCIRKMSKIDITSKTTWI